MVEEAFDAFIQARNEVELYRRRAARPGAAARPYRLFTASNGNADLGRIGLAHYFERSVAARQVGALKPDPLMFHKVIEGTDLRTGEVVYVGDDPELDVEGARGAGMRAIWINRLGVRGLRRSRRRRTTRSARWPTLVDGCWQRTVGVPHHGGGSTTPMHRAFP